MIQCIYLTDSKASSFKHCPAIMITWFQILKCGNGETCYFLSSQLLASLILSVTCKIDLVSLRGTNMYVKPIGLPGRVTHTLEWGIRFNDVSKERVIDSTWEVISEQSLNRQGQRGGVAGQAFQILSWRKCMNEGRKVRDAFEVPFGLNTNDF